MKYKFLLNGNFSFSKLMTTFSLIMYNFLSGQSVVTEIVRDEKGDILSIDYFGTASKKSELLKLETIHSTGPVITLKSFSSGLKNGVYEGFFINGNIKVDRQYTNGNKITYVNSYLNTTLNPENLISFVQWQLARLMLNTCFSFLHYMYF